MTTLDELFTRSRRRTGARPADDAPKRTGDGARAPDGDDATLDGARAPDAPQRLGGPTAAPTPRPARPVKCAYRREARFTATPGGGKGTPEGFPYWGDAIRVGRQFFNPVT